MDDGLQRSRSQLGGALHLSLHYEEFCMATAMMDQILEALDIARQRATYGAVAALVGVSPRALMSGRERNQRSSWIVNHRSGRPTGYPEEQLHPELASNPDVIKTREDLTAWLAARDIQLSTERAA